MSLWHSILELKIIHIISVCLYLRITSSLSNAQLQLTSYIINNKHAACLSNFVNIWMKKIMRPILAVLRIVFIQLFPNWTACSPITRTNRNAKAIAVFIRMSVENPIPNWLLRPITTKAISAMVSGWIRIPTNYL